MSEFPARAKPGTPGSKARPKSKWPIILVLGCLAVVLAVAGCLVLSSLGVIQLAKQLPTARPTPSLVVGQTYWVGAVLPPEGFLSGLVIRDALIYNKPGSSLSDPSIAIVADVPDATALTLSGIQDEYCYVEGEYFPLRDTGITDYSQKADGWIDCSRLLDYEPTPYPTPNLTPQQP